MGAVGLLRGFGVLGREGALVAAGGLFVLRVLLIIVFRVGDCVNGTNLVLLAVDLRQLLVSAFVFLSFDGSGLVLVI